MKKDIRNIWMLVMGFIMLVSVWGMMKNVVIHAEGNKAAGSSNVRQETESISEAADDKKYIVVVDPGHGGIDPGMLGVNDTIEKEINLSLSFILKDKLESMGIEVILTRETDDGLYSDNDKNKKIADMKERCRIISESNADIVVSIHQNSFSDSSVSGAQVFYYTHSAEGQKLAGYIQDSIKNNVDDTNTRKIKANDSYYMLVHTPCPTVIVECGFITNYDEAELLVTKEYQEKIADAIAYGVWEFLDK